MKTLLKNIINILILTTFSCQSTTTGYVVNKNKISKFNWIQISDTSKLKVCYLQLNFLNFPDDNYMGKSILDFTDSISTASWILTNKQRIDLFKLVSDTSNYSEGDCGTFHLNAGFILLDSNNVCATIDIGCGFNQWNFNPEIPNSKHTSFNEEGFKKMEKLLDDINSGNRHFE